jgi:uncharacterized membrane protein YhfC
MNILTLTYLLNGLLMVGIPVGLAIFLTRKYTLEWRLFWVGAGTFIFSQVGHIPFNHFVGPLFDKPVLARLPYSGQMIFTAVFLGLSAGLFEELARYAMYRWWAKDARSWPQGLLAGAGHGGVEAIAAGLYVLYFYIVFVILRANISLLSGDQQVLAQAQLNAYWSVPWYMSLLGAVERLFAIAAHLALSLMVMQALIRRRFWWVWAAIGFHALLDGLVVYASETGATAFQIEGIAGIFALAALVVIFLLRRSGPPPAPDKPAGPTSVPAAPKTVEETVENLDRSKYEP